MFTQVCDTVECSGVPVARVRRTFAVRHGSRGPVEHSTDRELCAGCLEPAVEQMYQPETIRGMIEPLTREK